MIQQHISLSIALSVVSTFGLGWMALRHWYFNLVFKAKNQVKHQDGRIVPLSPPRFFLGHLSEVYNADNRLAAYHQFHEQLGDIVQIFWLWRHQISITNLSSIRHVLVNRQQNYRKFPPNRLIQQLYGASVLTNHGRNWQRQRALMQDIFTPKQVAQFHLIFISCTEHLVLLWSKQLQKPEGQSHRDIYADLTALFLDIISQAAFGISSGALQGEMNEFLASVCFILEQSTHPLYQFIPWWQHLPLPKNRRLHQAFQTVDEYLYGLIQNRREEWQQGSSPSHHLLDRLIRETNPAEQDRELLSDKEVRDNLLAILLNGYETVATSVGFSLDLLARHPEKLALIQQEVDRVFAEFPLDISQLVKLPLLRAVIVESLRLCPPMAGIQRISLSADQLGPWTIPSEQAVGIPLRPIHLDPQHYGDNPEQFCPERYWVANDASAPPEVASGCPIQRFLGRETMNAVELPLTFGDGARRCLGETFALHEMAIALGLLVHHFDFSLAPGDGAEMELGKFGLFISMRPKHGIRLIIRERR